MNNSKFKASYTVIEEEDEMVKHMERHNASKETRWQCRYKMNLCKDCSFIVHRETMKYIFENFKEFPSEKCIPAYERILGIIFHQGSYSIAEKNMIELLKKNEIEEFQFKRSGNPFNIYHERLF